MRLSSDSLVSIVNLNPNINFEGTRKCGVSFREFNSNTANSLYKIGKSRPAINSLSWIIFYLCFLIKI